MYVYNEWGDAGRVCLLRGDFIVARAGRPCYRENDYVFHTEKGVIGDFDSRCCDYLCSGDGGV